MSDILQEIRSQLEQKGSLGRRLAEIEKRINEIPEANPATGMN